MRQKIRLGFDPGAKGGVVALYESGEIKMHRTPLVKKEIDINKFKNIIMDLLGDIDNNGNWLNDLQVIVEDVHSIFGAGAKSNFQFGRALGILEGIISALDIPYIKVAPKKWQSICFEGVPTIKKPGKPKLNKTTNQLEPSYSTDTKAMALIAAKRIFPNTSFIPAGCRVENDGLVDAALIAYYAKLKF